MPEKILVAGASRGLGLCLARKYLEDGNTVFACARDINSNSLVELKKQFINNLILVKMDVTSTESVNNASKSVSEHTDTLDIIINNAGIHCDTSFDFIEDADLDDCLAVYDVNAIGPLRVVKALLPFVTNDSNSLIVNISSECGSIGASARVKEFDYCMSKAALNMGTKLLQNYLKERNVKVIAVQPGWMRTDMGGMNADLDPYENACRLVELFDKTNNDVNENIFIDNAGNVLPW